MTSHRPPASALVGEAGTSDPGTPWLAPDGEWYQVWGDRGASGASHLEVYVYKAVAGSTGIAPPPPPLPPSLQLPTSTAASKMGVDAAADLKHFEFVGTFFDTHKMPSAWCAAYPPPGITNCTAENDPNVATTIECPDTFIITSTSTSTTAANTTKNMMTNASTNGGPATHPSSASPQQQKQQQQQQRHHQQHPQQQQQHQQHQVLIGSLGCGALGTAAWWAAPTPWVPSNGEFAPEMDGVLDFGVMYAPKTAASADGTNRRILFGWVMEAWCAKGCRYGDVCGVEAQPPVDWDGTNALSRELTIDTSSNELLQDPVPEAASLRVPESARSLGPWVRHCPTDAPFTRGTQWGATPPFSMAPHHGSNHLI